MRITSFDSKDFSKNSLAFFVGYRTAGHEGLEEGAMAIVVGSLVAVVGHFEEYLMYFADAWWRGNI